MIVTSLSPKLVFVFQYSYQLNIAVSGVYQLWNTPQLQFSILITSENSQILGRSISASLKAG